MANQYDLAIRIAGKLDPSLKNSAKKASGLISSIVKADLIASGIKTASSAIKNFVGDSIQSYTNFEQSLANAGAIASATSEDLNKMKKASMDAGAKTSFTAAQSADALGYMALAGWDTATSIKSLTPVLRLAESTGADLATTSDQVTDSMSAMGINVNDLSNYLDVLAMTNNKSNTTASSLMQAMIGAGSATKAAGMDYKQTATALGVLANNGIKGAEAGTALNSMLSRMTSNKKAQSAYKNLGVSVFDANGKIRDFQTILSETDKALSKLNDKERAKAITDIAGVNYGGQYQFLLKGVQTAKDGSTEWGNLANNINNAGGALDIMNKRATSTMKGSFTRFSSAIDGARIALIDKFAPTIQKVVDYLASSVIPKLTNAIKYLADPIANSIEYIKRLAKAFIWITDVDSRLKDLQATFYKYKDVLQFTAVAVAGLTVAIVAYNASAIASAIASGAQTVAIWAYVTATNIATVATTALGAVLAFLTSPITLIVAGLTALVAAGIYVYKNWDMIKAKAVELWNVFSSKFPALANVIKTIFITIKNVITDYINFVKNAWIAIGNFLVSAWNIYKNFLAWIQNTFTNIFVGAWNVAKTGFFSFVNSIKIYVTSLLSVLNSICDFVKNVFSGNWAGAWQNIKDIFSNAFTGLKAIALAPLNAIIDMINYVINKMNGISFKVPDWVPGSGGETVGINVANIPHLATGGIATKPTTALIGEGSEPEAVLPLSKLNSLFRSNSSQSSNVTFAPVININGSATKTDVSEAVSEAFEEFKRLNERLERDKRRKQFRTV